MINKEPFLTQGFKHMQDQVRLFHDSSIFFLSERRQLKQQLEELKKAQVDPDILAQAKAVTMKEWGWRELSTAVWLNTYIYETMRGFGVEIKLEELPGESGESNRT